MAAGLTSRNFGHLSTGEPVEAWTLTGEGGLQLEAITYGGIVTRLLAPDRNGALTDVVLGFGDLAPYLVKHPYFGAITGRVAGRTTGAAFTLDGKTYELAQNDGPNHLHGGLQGFDKKLWNATPVERGDGAPSLQLAYRSPDGEEGYPGTLDVTVTYTVAADNTFLIDTEATTDQATPVNLTNHSYFNLAGESAGSIDDHVLQVFADEFVPNDEHMTLLSPLEKVSGGNDFREPRRLGEAIPLLFQNHGSMYRVRRDEAVREKAPAARLVHPGSGRVLSVFTDEDYIQVYMGSKIRAGLVGKSGVEYGKHGAICLECHGYPDGVNAPQMGDIVVRPGTPQRRSTAYTFSTVAE